MWQSRLDICKNGCYVYNRDVWPPAVSGRPGADEFFICHIAQGRADLRPWFGPGVFEMEKADAEFYYVRQKKTLVDSRNSHMAPVRRGGFFAGSVFDHAGAPA
jgi:hypothetical protein